jgi:alpha-beta hydrolase superfamily lysophospholipase
MWEFLQAEIKAHPTYGRLPVFVLGESMGGNVAIQLGLKDLDEGEGHPRLHGAILLAPMVTIKAEMKPPQVLIDLLKKVGGWIRWTLLGLFCLFGSTSPKSKP